jgi:uncharacterized protein (TIGR03382 family)
MSVQVAEATKVTASAERAVAIGRRNGALPLVTAGGATILLAVAGLGLGALLHRSDAPVTPPAVTAAAEPAPREIVVAIAYAPGESSGWHLHPVNHTVQVLSGSLAVYDVSCQVRSYGPGETYVGGTEAHLTRNEGDVPVQMIVSSTEPSVAANSVTHVVGPAGCSVA